MDKMKIVIVKDGNKYCCYDENNFKNLQESKAYFGKTPKKALKKFLKKNKLDGDNNG